MIKKVRDFFFLEEAKASDSDKAVIILLLIVGVFAVYALAVGYGGLHA
ncbi:hypothetical protein LZ480_07565 [Solibacillus sp. MA9]|uniref:Uncharacterized protein n=1 Tax=Solibacillus palustris TaxID=2908203 RepID=A0ABS9UBP6_9BACL|nr:hypothetical protein [Solibacillus sp. MA9]MCH7321749.1 hypothetical protein [Solibacillus sp. MA9]